MSDSPKMIECTTLLWSHEDPAETFKDNYEALINQGWQLVAFIPDAPEGFYTTVLFQRITEEGRKLQKKQMQKAQKGLMPLIMPK